MSLLPLLRYQSYIDQAMHLPIDDDDMIRWRQGVCPPDIIRESFDYDLHRAEKDYNPDKFPEWNRISWPGNCHIAKRYAVHFGVDWDPESIWLDAPKAGYAYDIVIHLPTRRIRRPVYDWFEILNGLCDNYDILIVGDESDYDQWDILAHKIAPKSFLETASYIKSARLFLGVASSCNVIAEAMKKRRLVELADDCFNTYPYGLTGQCINDFDVSQVITEAEAWLDGAKSG